MHNTPPGEDEQAETLPARRRRQSSVPPRQRPVDYHADEHPEIPKIRRASLYIDQTVAPAELPVQEDEEEEFDERHEQVRNTPPALHTPRPLARDTSKIVVARRRPHKVYTPPPPPARHTRPHIQPKRTFQDQLIRWSHNQPLMIISSLVVVILIVGIIVTNVSRISTTEIGTSGTPQSANTPTGVQQVGALHELVITPEDTDHPAPPVFATSAYLLDADTGATLYAHNPFMHLPMMSTTKLMTAVLAVEHGNPDQEIPITGAIANDISQLSADSTLFGLKKGETYTLRDLLYGLLLQSGNDAAVAIADTLSGNLNNFVAEMNQRAQQLGLYDTHYMNPHGLLATDHYSSAHDLAILGRYSMSIPLIHQISGAETHIIPKTATHPEHDVLNGSQFLWWYPGVDGGKPGYDGGSNFVQVISCTRNHHHLIGVVMHTINWWTDMRDLLNWGFDNFNWISPHDVDSEQNPIPYDYLWNYFASDKKESTLTTAVGGRYYIYTGFSVADPILSYFDQHGGLQQLGYPTSMLTISGTSASQRFEQGTIRCDLTSKQCTTG